MKNKNGTYTVKNESGTVTLYVDTLSQDIVDIEVAPGETCVKFETERINTRNSAYNTRVRLWNIFKQFPDVTTIEIGSGVYSIDINNETFPNVRHLFITCFFVFSVDCHDFNITHAALVFCSLFHILISPF